MGLIWVLVLAVLSVIGAALSRQFADEFKVWTPVLIRWLVKRAVKKLPENRRDRFTEEWQSHIDEIPGEVGKILVALGLGSAAQAMSLSIGERPEYRLKRAFDITLSIGLLLFQLPLLILIIIGIKAEDGGPVFFRHYCVGKDGKPFGCLKFRTVTSFNADEILSRHPPLPTTAPVERAETFQPKHDLRLTRFGRLLWKLGLDEVPQLINVLKGDMSFVGPRPRSAAANSADANTSCRPGIVGLWALGRDDDDEAELDKQYLNQRSLWYDLKILRKTLLVILRG